MVRPPWAKDEHEEAFDPHDLIPQWEVDWLAREIGSGIIRTGSDFLNQTAIKSNGRAGEDAARWWFKQHGWDMTKVEASARCHKCGSHTRIAQSGLPDFIGYVPADDGIHDFIRTPQFRACEIKEATEAEGDKVPHSRLSEAQRLYMSSLPETTAYVGILWRDGVFEVFAFDKQPGSYKKGAGLKK